MEIIDDLCYNLNISAIEQAKKPTDSVSAALVAGGRLERQLTGSEAMQIIQVAQRQDEAVIDNRIADWSIPCALTATGCPLENQERRRQRRTRQLLELRGENWSNVEGYARLMAEEAHVLRLKALDDLIIRDPLHYSRLKDSASGRSSRQHQVK